MANLDFGDALIASRPRKASALGTDFSEAFFNEVALKRALSALQRGPIRFHRDNVIACDGDSADYLFLVVSGVVRTCKTFENGSRNIVAFYLPGELFGWPNLDLSVEAATDAIVLFIKRKPLNALAARENRIANFLLELMTNELKRAQEHALLMGRNARCRVTRFLTELSSRSGKLASLDLPMSHKDIADHLGLTIETLSRVITGLERTGLVSRASPRRLIIKNKLALERVLD
jgi:CRP/FNR family nitrogen fixation transcriptional regulator